MIINSKEIISTILEFNREDLVKLLIGETITQEVFSFTEGWLPTHFKIYCSNPFTKSDIKEFIVSIETNEDRKF